MARITIGIDGGGSGCRVAVVRDGTRLAGAKGGPANVHSDFDGALTNVHAAFAAATDGLTAEELGNAAICAGLAGARTGSLAADFAGAFPHLIRVVDDTVTTLAGALGSRDGIVASLGTGSFFAAQIGGERRVIGGWGFRLGDEASAAWLGRRLLSRALWVRDGRAPADPLVEAVLASVDAGGGPLVFSHLSAPADYAALAPLILRHSDTPTARILLDDTLSHLGRGIADAGHGPGLPIVLMGSLGQALAPMLPEALKRDLAAPLGSALDGALALAEHP